MERLNPMGYRDKFPKGPDWEEPTNCNRVNSDAYHGMEVIGVSIEKYNNILSLKLDSINYKLDEDYAQCMVERNSFLLEKEQLEEEVEKLKTELYFAYRNQWIEEIVEKNEE